MDKLHLNLLKAGLVKSSNMGGLLPYLGAQTRFAGNWLRSSLPRFGEALKSAPGLGTYVQKVLGAPKPKSVPVAFDGPSPLTPYGELLKNLDAARAAKDLAYKNISPWVKYPLKAGLTAGSLYSGLQGFPLGKAGTLPFWFYGYGKKLQEAGEQGALVPAMRYKEELDALRSQLESSGPFERFMQFLQYLFNPRSILDPLSARSNELTKEIEKLTGKPYKTKEQTIGQPAAADKTKTDLTQPKVEKGLSTERKSDSTKPVA